MLNSGIVLGPPMVQPKPENPYRIRKDPAWARLKPLIFCQLHLGTIGRPTMQCDPHESQATSTHGLCCVAG